MKQVTINLRKITTGSMCEDKSMCVMGQIVHKCFSVDPKFLLNTSGPEDVSDELEENRKKKLGQRIRRWAKKNEGVISELIVINDGKGTWRQKAEKMRPLIKKLGYAPRFVE